MFDYRPEMAPTPANRITMNIDRPATYTEAIASAEHQLRQVSDQCVRLEREVRRQQRKIEAYERYVRMLKRPKPEPELSPGVAELIKRQEDE